MRLRHSLACLAVEAMCAWVGGCAGLETVTIERTNLSVRLDHGATFLLVRAEDQQEGAEFDAIAGSIAAHMEAIGFRRVSRSDDAKYILTFAYGISGKFQVTGSTPIYGQVGVGTTFAGGTMYGGPGGPLLRRYGNSTPVFGVIGYAPYRRVDYEKFLALRLTDRPQAAGEQGVIAYQGKVTSLGIRPTFAGVAECLVDQLFENFLQNGVVTKKYQCRDA